LRIVWNETLWENNCHSGFVCVLYLFFLCLWYSPRTETPGESWSAAYVPNGTTGGDEMRWDVFDCSVSFMEKLYFQKSHSRFRGYYLKYKRKVLWRLIYVFDCSVCFRELIIKERSLKNNCILLQKIQKKVIGELILIL
jgi:hypothetical protein